MAMGIEVKRSDGMGEKFKGELNTINKGKGQ